MRKHPVLAGSHKEGNYMNTTVAERVIDFFANLQGVNYFQTSLKHPRKAVLDLNTAAIIEAHPDFPDGEMLMYEGPSGVRSTVSTNKLKEQLFVRHALEMSVMEGSSAKEQYQHISDHFDRKTGYGQ